MHFEILVEGQSERTALETLLKKILGPYKQPHTWTIHKHQGLGRIPAKPSNPPNKKDKSLLHNLPSKLRAYEKSLSENDAVVVLADLDEKNCIEFKKQVIDLLSACTKAPTVLFRIAIEELEAWYLGDREALLKAYPDTRIDELNAYRQDSICGTWEKLAEIVYPGGLKALEERGARLKLEQKRIWARDITPHMDVENNHSPSFRCFREGMRRFASMKESNPKATG